MLQQTVQAVVEVDEKEPSAVAPHEVLGLDFWSGQAGRLKDGGGITSDADWSTPRAEDSLKGLRQILLGCIARWNLVERLTAHIAGAQREPLLNDGEQHSLRSEFVAFLTSKGFPCTSTIEQGQPLTLEIWHALLAYLQDIDCNLPSILKEGVPTGIVSDIQASGVWIPTDTPERPDLELVVHDSPWGSAADDPKCLMELVQADISAGFAEWLPGGLAEAKRRYGNRCAAGRLGLVKKEGKEPRLVGDSSIPHANHMCRIPERIELPTLHDVAQFVSRCPQLLWQAFSLDVAKAHKRIRVHPSERGLSLFAAIDERGDEHWFQYNTTHFGCSWAAYWWARVAAAFMRILHILLHCSHFLAIYVDDLLGLFPKQSAPLSACLCVLLAEGLGIPLSWHKLQLCDSLTWIGWRLSFASDPVATLPDDKRTRLLNLLKPLTKAGARIGRKELRKIIGLLCWFTAGARWLKPFLCQWFHCLLKPKMVLQNLDSLQLCEVCGLLNGSLVVQGPCKHCDVQPGWTLLTVGSRAVKSQKDIFGGKAKNGKIWCKFGDPASTEVRLTKEEAKVASLFYTVVAADVPIELRSAWQPGNLAAADAYAEGGCAGTGGWWLPANCALTPENICWFSIELAPHLLPSWFLCQGSEDLQPYICALEAFAQLTLLACQMEHTAGKISQGWLAVRQRCDNMGVVGANDKALSMKRPLADVLQSTTMFCARHRVQLHISHIAGERNDWADWLSRGRSKNPKWWSRLSAEKRFEPNWLELLCLCQQLGS